MSFDRDAFMAAKRRSDQWAESGAAREEDARCRLILKLAAAAPVSVVRAIEEKQRQQNQGRLLRYDLLRDLVPTFPFWLGHSTLDGERLHTSSRATLSAVFARFDATPFARAYAKFYQNWVHAAAQRGLGLGLTFTRKGVIHGLVMHDANSFPVVGTRLCRRCPGAELTLWVDTFAALLRAIRSSGWRPEYAF